MPRLRMRCGDWFMIGIVCHRQQLAQWTDQRFMDLFTVLPT